MIRTTINVVLPEIIRRKLRSDKKEEEGSGRRKQELEIEVEVKLNIHWHISHIYDEVLLPKAEIKRAYGNILSPPPRLRPQMR